MSPAFSPVAAAGSPNSNASRGGRPRDWTDSRSRKLVRLYLYTDKPVEVILNILKEQNWTPGKDAANKILHKLLGNDPRWLRPKSVEEENQLVKALEGSTRHVHRHAQPGLPSNADDRRHATPLAPSSTVFPTRAWPSPPRPIASSHVEDSVVFRASFELKQNTRSNSGLSDITVSSMTNSFIERLTLNQIPQPGIRNAWKLQKRFTLPSKADATVGSTSSPWRAVPPGHHIFPSIDTYSNIDYFSAGFAVPGDLIDIGGRLSYQDRRGCDTNSKAHRSETCWCAIPKQIYPYSTDGYLLEKLGAQDPIEAWFLDDVDTTAVDDFGHTPFHLLASLGNCHVQLLTLVNQAINSEDKILTSVNTAGQTFLHVLHPSWYLPESLLERLMNSLKKSTFNLYCRDVFGRNFFHIMREYGTDFQRVQELARGLDKKKLNARDAFGRSPLRPSPSATSIHAARTIRVVIAAQRLGSPSAGAPPHTESDSRIIAQTRLLKTIYAATSPEVEGVDRFAEDVEGRNGFHALAEVILGLNSLQERINKGTKRKLDNVRADEQDRHVPMKRIVHMEALIVSQVDINHYNVAGDTPLMAFVVHLSEVGGRQNISQVREIINRLVKAGADMERRNRRGETALHLAARHGQKVAVDVLLKLGANPYARNADGDSILNVVDRMWENSSGVSNSSYEACRKLLTGQPMSVQPKQDPTRYDEWTFARRSAVA